MFCFLHFCPGTGIRTDFFQFNINYRMGKALICGVHKIQKTWQHCNIYKQNGQALSIKSFAAEFHGRTR